MMHHPGRMELIPEDMCIRVLTQCAIGTANGLHVRHRILCKVVSSHIAGLLAVCEAQGSIAGHLRVHHYLLHVLASTSRHLLWSVPDVQLLQTILMSRLKHAYICELCLTVSNGRGANSTAQWGIVQAGPHIYAPIPLQEACLTERCSKVIGGGTGPIVTAWKRLGELLQQLVMLDQLCSHLADCGCLQPSYA